MKNLHLFVIFVLMPLVFIGQDYHCIVDNAEHMFSNGEHYRAIQIDSIKEFTDFTSFYQFYTIGSTDDYQECYSDEHPSWIGSHVDVYNSGAHHFFNVAGDTILVKAGAGVGDEWLSYTFDNGDYVRGKTTAIEFTDFLGQNDSVKVIQFNAFDSGGNPVSNSVNGMQIRVSKSWGMVQSLNFKLFPDLYDYPFYEFINEYTLVGMSEPQEGIQNLTIKDIYDFDVGDEFHVHEYAVSWLQEQYFYYETHQIIDKTWVSDTLLNYLTERCIRREYVASDTLIIIHDTVLISVDLNSYEDSGLNTVPDKVLHLFDGWGTEYYWYSQFIIEGTYNYDPPDKMCKYFNGGYFYEEWQDCIVGLIDYDFSKYYMEGLGGPYWYYGMFGSENFRGVVYFKKGEEEWGEPYDCDSLMVGIPIITSNNINVVVAPNPMNEWTRIEINMMQNRKVSYFLINSMGTPVQEGIMREPVVVLHRNDLPPGMYFLQIIEDKKVVHHKKLIIQ